MGFLDRPQAVWWRKALFQIHLWTGVAIGLYVLAISLSGSVLVFQRELENDAPRLPESAAPANIEYDALCTTALGAHPGASLQAIDLRSRTRRVVPIELRDREESRIVYLDSYSGKIVRDVSIEKEHRVTRFLVSLHNELLAGRNGAVANSIGGLLLFAMSASGIILWWPGRKHWRRVLKVRWNARWARVNWDMHSAFGFWTLLFVSMWAATGVYFIWPQQTRNAVAKLCPMPHFEEEASTWTPGQPIQPVNRYVAVAGARYPASQLAYVYMDVYRVGGVVKVFLSPDPEQSLTMLEDVVTFEPATMRVLSDQSTSKLNPAERISLALYSIHFGDFGGLWLKIAWSTIGLVPGVLAATGYLIWWSRVLKKKLRQLLQGRN